MTQTLASLAKLFKCTEQEFCDIWKATRRKSSDLKIQRAISKMGPDVVEVLNDIL